MLALLSETPMIVLMSDTPKSTDLSSIYYAILEKIVKMPNYPIKKYQNCSMYFIPNAKLDEIYCDYPKEIGKTYQQKFSFVKNKQDKQLKKVVNEKTVI